MGLKVRRSEYSLAFSASCHRVQELCESRGGRPGLPVLMNLTVSVDVKQHRTMLRHWSQFVPNNYVNRHPRTGSSTSLSSVACTLFSLSPLSFPAPTVYRHPLNRNNYYSTLIREYISNNRHWFANSKWQNFSRHPVH